MTLKLTVAAPTLSALETPLLVVALPTAPTLTDELRPIDAATGGALGRALARRDFRGGRDETLHLSGGERGVLRVLLVGMGTVADRAAALRRAGAIAGRQANKLGVGELAFFAGALDASQTEAIGIGLNAGCVGLQRNENADRPPTRSARRSPRRRFSAAATRGCARRSRSAKGTRSRDGSACCRATSARQTIWPIRHATSRSGSA